MKSITEILNSLLNYEHKYTVKNFASQELDEINYQIKILTERRDKLEPLYCERLGANNVY